MAEEMNIEEILRLIPLSQVTVTRGLAGVLRANMAR